MPGFGDMFDGRSGPSCGARASSTSTSRCTRRSRRSSPTGPSGAGCRPPTATCWSTSSRTSPPPTSCSCGCCPPPASTCSGSGDDDQTIYEHAGADPRFLIEYATLFPAAADHPLEVNYRCPTRVVEAAGHLLSYNHVQGAEGHPPRARGRPASRGGGGPARGGRRLGPGRGGAAWLEDGAEPVQVAVLSRIRSGLLAPHVALVEAGVPVSSIPLADVLDRTGVRAALAYLRLATSPASLDPDDLCEVYRRPSRGLPNWITKWFRHGPRRPGPPGDRPPDSTTPRWPRRSTAWPTT